MRKDAVRAPETGSFARPAGSQKPKRFGPFWRHLRVEQGNLQGAARKMAVPDRAAEEIQPSDQ
jgi:hypothetical protein